MYAQWFNYVNYCLLLYFFKITVMCGEHVNIGSSGDNNGGDYSWGVGDE